jgi:ATP-dependent Clp protease ATP-binding subunit ClpB
MSKETPESDEGLDGQIRELLSQYFKPEFLNRIDEIVVFHTLRGDELQQIVDIQIEKLQTRLEEKQIAISFTEGAREHLAMTGYDPIYGARPLRRVIQKEVENPLAMKILGKEFVNGDNIFVDLGNDGLVFTRQPRYE